ncbi:hypothetical protein CVT26_003698, partial [Gymnopilus dilepis]
SGALRSIHVRGNGVCARRPFISGAGTLRPLAANGPQRQTLLTTATLQRHRHDHENPFASTHSLDTNPFDDPQPQQEPASSARLEEIRRREQDLERLFPLIFHSIPDEIPEAHRPLITRLYQLWLVLLGTLIVNMVACIFILTAGSASGGGDLGASLGYLIFISILSFLLWYRSKHYTTTSTSSLADSTCSSASTCIPGTGSAGLIQTIREFSSHHWVAAILGLIATVGWTIQGVGNAYYYRQIYNHHTAAGHTMEKAQAKGELATHGAKAYFTRG